MPRFLRLFNHMIHVPSLSSVSISTSCFGKPFLCLHFHTQKTLNIYYRGWDECQAAMSKLKSALIEVEAALAPIPLVEATSTPTLPLVSVSSPILATTTPSTDSISTPNLTVSLEDESKQQKND